MYVVLDVEQMMKAKHPIRRRQRPIGKFGSTLLLRPGTKLDLIPAGSEIRYSYGSWEVHMPITNKNIVKKLAKALDAIAYI